MSQYIAIILQPPSGLTLPGPVVGARLTLLRARELASEIGRLLEAVERGEKRHWAHLASADAESTFTITQEATV